MSPYQFGNTQFNGGAAVVGPGGDGPGAGGDGAEPPLKVDLRLKSNSISTDGVELCYIKLLA